MRGTPVLGALLCGRWSGFDPKHLLGTLKTQKATYDRGCRVSRFTYTCINIRYSRAIG